MVISLLKEEQYYLENCDGGGVMTLDNKANEDMRKEYGSNWINVNQSLPHESATVLVTGCNEYGNYWGPLRGVVLAGTWYCVDTGHAFSEDKALVSYWMPMPALPTEG